ncbi:MAG: RNase P subunit p30 family protein [Candidatus Sifarchaeia archaeon]
MVIDLGVCVSDPEDLESFVQMARKIGFTGIATHNIEGKPDQFFQDGFSVLRRVDISGRGLKSVRKKVESERKQVMIVSVTLTSIEIANWAADNQRVDLLTLDAFRDYRFRDSTASLAADFNTALEVRFEPLLHSIGLNRSKIIKNYRESIRTAIDAGMQVILSSGAKHPLQMRSPTAIQHIGQLLGMKPEYLENAIKRAPLDIIERNRGRFDPSHVGEGVKIL